MGIGGFNFSHTSFYSLLSKLSQFPFKMGLLVPSTLHPPPPRLCWGSELRAAPCVSPPVFISFLLLSAPVFGYLGDRHSRKATLSFGILLWSGAGLSSSFIPPRVGALSPSQAPQGGPPPSSSCDSAPVELFLLQAGWGDCLPRAERRVFSTGRWTFLTGAFLFGIFLWTELGVGVGVTATVCGKWPGEQRPAC